MTAPRVHASHVDEPFVDSVSPVKESARWSGGALRRLSMGALHGAGVGPVVSGPALPDEAPRGAEAQKPAPGVVAAAAGQCRDEAAGLLRLLLEGVLDEACEAALAIDAEARALEERLTGAVPSTA